MLKLENGTGQALVFKSAFRRGPNRWQIEMVDRNFCMKSQIRYLQAVSNYNQFNRRALEFASKTKNIGWFLAEICVY